MFGELIHAVSRGRQKLNEATIKRGALFYVLFWGVLYFGGGMLIVRIYLNVFRAHQSLASFLTGKVVVEHLFGGLMVGTIWWLMEKPVPPSPNWRLGLKRPDPKN
jgi:hypothetical protein